MGPGFGLPIRQKSPVAKSPRVAKQCDVNIQSINQSIDREIPRVHDQDHSETVPQIAFPRVAEQCDVNIKSNHPSPIPSDAVPVPTPSYLSTNQRTLSPIKSSQQLGNIAPNGMEERCTFHFPKTPSCQLHSVTAASNKHCLEIAWLSLYLKQASVSERRAPMNC
ncbi:uncharacterized protein TNCV_4492091 [Trichonephila clavipes]|nr:uncharacterized protein TNCV_4492091 [Trichonephila clavipes]